MKKETLYLDGHYFDIHVLTIGNFSGKGEASDLEVKSKMICGSQLVLKRHFHITKIFKMQF